MQTCNTCFLYISHPRIIYSTYHMLYLQIYRWEENKLLQFEAEHKQFTTMSAPNKCDSKVWALVDIAEFKTHLKKTKKNKNGPNIIQLVLLKKIEPRDSDNTFIRILKIKSPGSLNTSHFLSEPSQNKMWHNKKDLQSKRHRVIILKTQHSKSKTSNFSPVR